MATSRPWRGALLALSEPYRRQLLVALLEKNPQDDDDVDPLGVLDDSTDGARNVETELFHNHLPMLEEMEFIEWDRDRGDIKTGPNWDDIAPLLRLIRDHRDELPDDWP